MSEPSTEKKASAEAKPSHMEHVKETSDFLRGTIAQELVDGNAFFCEDNANLLKTHGTYQQDNRDARGESGKAANAASGKAAGGKEYMFMVRTKIPGGKLTWEQLLAELDLADRLGNNTLRLTTRQGLQLHGVLKSNLREVIHEINASRLSTLGACGDVNRNVMACPAPYAAPMYTQVQAFADELAAHFAPRTRAYHELWVRELGAEQEQFVTGGPAEIVEPIYGKNYLPRKFKQAIGFDFDNCVDLYANDVGWMAVVENGAILGYNVLVGGGLGVTPAKKTTFPALAKRMGFVTPDQALAVAEAIVKVQRDFGNRSDRKQARMKYLIHNWGLEKFKATVEEYYGRKIDPCHPSDVRGFDDHIGWFAQGDGKFFYGLNIENGRVADTEQASLKTALREICRELKPGVRLTSHQSILFTDLAESARETIDGALRRHRVRSNEETSTVRRWSMACVAWPTCGLSITEAERALPGIIDQVEVELTRHGLQSEKFTIRMTGCPNGCARPYNADIGLVGKAREKYTIYLGGRLLGDRLGFIYKDMVPEDQVVPTLAVVFGHYKQARTKDETFGDFCHRQGKEALLAHAEN